MAAATPIIVPERIGAARSLASRLPELLIDARRVAANVMLGVHGRRRAGPGETFWEFRPYTQGEPARRIDWRRSARDRHLYVREREWEASQTVWLWADLSPSMDFRSRLAETSKLDRAVVLILALADMLGRGGERIGLPGLLEPRIGRNAAERFATALMQSGAPSDWPNLDRVARFAEVVVIGDFLSDAQSMRTHIQDLATKGANLHLLQVLDPAEEAFPFEGRLEFRDPETGAVWTSERAGSIRDRYKARLGAHRDAISEAARSAGFSFGVHHTDRPAAEGLLFLQGRLGGGRSAIESGRAPPEPSYA
ncbi:DUF58 domain-containing protein [Propylenella binzhouense]|uniref:DUF58 domain-containing protein n=1 Tax=Propylenella binzhouense TaxID=2555902 RepID=A0A964WS91_9HYPH|nr:DUF58 domain-containing protein [Propylenella binzhouense]MYZ46728.1 DUF58 domain-containing protein [Propylenella binzhouense]